ncbi:DNA cytosine methyltransferase [Sorangium sp. So ce185]|uniref:DNA cytosine methyltransferase n=1 Tax=Sorangium sp. So ce185 TaxID=3133287 RepID=UPI003F627C0B
MISVFSGAGGLDIGLERAGWHIETACDIDTAAVASLRASQSARIPIEGSPTRRYLDGTRILEADVRDLRGADLRPAGAKSTWRPSLLAGGPPCQPWSSAGLQRGFKDARGLLIAQMLRLADELKPRYVLMENVRGLLTAVGPKGQHGEAIQIIQAEWENLGYAVNWALMNAADYGAAQRRVRLVMMATADHHLPSFPEPTHDEVSGLFRKPWVSLGEFLARRPKPDPADVVVPCGKRAAELMALEPGTGIRTGGTVEHQRPGGHWGYRQDSFLADLSLPSRTIRAASTPDWVKPDGESMRRLTWRECAALQGFPDEWVFEGPREAKFRLSGNAVQTDMAKALGTTLIEALKQGQSKITPESPEWPAYFSRRIRGAAADHRANAASRVRYLALKAS